MSQTLKRHPFINRAVGACLLTFCLALTSPWTAQVSLAADTAPWVKLERLTGGAVDSVVFDTAHPGVAFAGSDAGFIYRSSDGGATWQSIAVGTVVEGFRAIAVSPAQAGTIYAYSTDNFFGGQGTLYRSVDDGKSWAPTPHQPSSAITGSYYAGLGRGIAIDSTGKILVLADAFSGVLRSGDGGGTWTNPVPNAATYGLAADPNHSGVLWVAGSDYATGLASIWKSTDFGATWTVQAPAAFNPPGVFNLTAYAITVQPGTGKILANWTGQDPATFFLNGGMVVSTDNGVTWTSSSTGLLPTYSPGNAAASIVFDPVQPSTVYLSTNGDGFLDGDGFYISHDSGASWQPAGNRIRTLSGFTVAARPAEPGYPAALFVGYPDLFVSIDHGATFARSDTGLDGGFAQSVADDGLSPPGLYAATGVGLFHSTNGGHDWTRINTWNGYDGIGQVAVDMNSATRTVYAASQNHVWKSLNAGASWNDVTPPSGPGTAFGAAYADPAVAGHLVVIANTQLPPRSAMVYRTNDGGQTWSGPSCDIQEDGIGALLFAPAPPGRLYLARESGLWVSDDGGSTCVQAPVQPLPGGFIVSISEAGTNPTALLVSGFQATGEITVMRSADAGGSYQVVTPLPSITFNAPFLSTSPDLQVAFAVVAGSAIAVSRDGGASWTTQPDRLFPVSAGAAYLSPTRSKVFWGDISGALYSAPYGALH